MNVLVAIICVTIGYIAGLHVGRNTVKISCPGIIKIARDENDNGYYCALEVKGKGALQEIYKSDTVTFEVQRMSETQIKQGL